MGLAIVETPSPRDDAELIAACIRGDREAERVLFQREYPRVHAMVYRLLGSSRDADDLVQETFIAAFRALPRFRAESKLSTWIDRIGVRIVFKHVAARKRAAVPLDLVPEPEDAQGTPHERSSAREGLRRMYAALDNLKPDARTAFVLYAIDGRSIAEVARLTGMSALAAKLRIWRARREMARRAAADPVLAEFFAAGGDRGGGVNLDRIQVTVPTSDARRDRVERATFEQLAAMSRVDRADAAAVLDPRPRWGLRLALAAAAVAAGVVLYFAMTMTRPTSQPDLARAPSRVVTPVGGASRFTIGDAVIDAGGDTSVEVNQSGDGAIALVLARGSVDCDVMPRRDRPPFRVIAGDVTVEVVGTRFAVTRGATGVRVDVARGKVRVTAAGALHMVGAGETWSSTEVADADAVPATPAPLAPATPVATPLPPPQPKPVRVTPPSSHDAFTAAQRLESTDRDAAARGYRRVAAGTDNWGALALYSLAELDVARGRTASALDEIAEYEARFGAGANAEDASWLRVEVLRSSGKTEAARAAATSYLARFPAGTYADTAKYVVGPAR